MQVQPRPLPAQEFPLRCSGVRDGRRCNKTLGYGAITSGSVSLKCRCCGHVNVFQAVVLKPAPAS